MKSTPQQKKSNTPQARKADQSRVAAPVKKTASISRLPVYLLFGFAIFLYVDSLYNQYALDDRLMITENAFTKKGISGIGDILSNDSFVGFFGKQKNLVAGGRYRPLSHIMFAIEFAIFGANPFIGHLLNILLYAFAGVLVYKVLQILFPPGKKPFYLTLSFIAAALFVAHPLHTEAVANIKGRDEILSLLGSFGALYFMLKYIESSRLVHLLWASVIFFLALLSKENAITFVAIIPLTLYFFTKARGTKILFPLAGLLVVSAVFVAIRSAVLGYLMTSNIDLELLNNPFVNSTEAQKFATIFYTWGRYLVLLIFPHPLTHDYYPKQIPIINFNDIRAIISIVIYACMIVYTLMRIKQRDIVAYCILFFGLTFSISSNLVFPIGTFMNDRFMFVPLLGFTILIAYLCTEKFPKWLGELKAKQVTMSLVGIMIFAYSVKTIARNPVWYDDYTLFTTDVKVSENSAKCNVSAGGQTLELAEKETDQVKKKKMISDAIVYLNKGVRIHPRYTAGWVLLGKAMIYLEDYTDARAYYKIALGIAPTQQDALNNWLYCAQMSAKNKDYKEAKASYRELMKFQPENKDLIIDVAAVLESENQIDSVLYLMRKVLKENPKSAPALSKIGEMYGKHLNNLDSSIVYLMKAYEISPTDGSLLENLGVAFGIKKNYVRSIEFFKKAIEAKPDDAQIYMNLSGSYLNSGDKVNAAKCQQKANELSASTVKVK
jgi:tetratricopeptide (TPR) repeat protein